MEYYSNPFLYAGKIIFRFGCGMIQRYVQVSELVTESVHYDELARDGRQQIFSRTPNDS